MGDQVARVVGCFFWWRFWAPFDCVGGPVYWGFVCEVEWPDGDEVLRSFQSIAQIEAKRSLGWIK